MKKLITITLFALMSLSGFGQLSNEAKAIKDKLPKYYNPIREAAVKEWKSDHRMVVYEINRRSEAFMKWREYYLAQEEGTEERRILLQSMLEWQEGDEGMRFNWPMVIYEFEKQMESYNSY